MKPKLIDGVWRVVYDDRLEWVKRRGLGGKPVTGVIFSSVDDAWAWLDKIDGEPGAIK